MKELKGERTAHQRLTGKKQNLQLSVSVKDLAGARDGLRDGCLLVSFMAGRPNVGLLFGLSPVTYLLVLSLQQLMTCLMEATAK